MNKTCFKIKSLLKFMAVVTAYAVPFVSGVLLVNAGSMSTIANVIGAVTMALTTITFVVTFPKYY